MGAYKRKLAMGILWFYSGQYKNVKYFSKAEFATKQECKNAESKHIREIERELRRPQVKMGLLELCNSRLDYVKAAKSQAYYKDNKRAFSKMLEAIGDMPVHNVTRSMMHKHFLNESVRLNSEGKDNYQVNADIKMIKALFNYAINELELMDHNPTKKITPYPVDYKLKYIPPDRDIDLVCDMVNSSQKRLIIFAKESACRIGEAIRATGNDIDLEMDLLTLWTRKKKNSNLVPRRIPLHPDLREMKIEGRLFPDWTDRPHFLEKVCKRAKITPFGWHAFRHRKASIMAKNNVPLVEIMHYLGHDNIEVTQKYLRILGHTKY